MRQTGGSMESNLFLDSLLVDVSVDICVASICGCSLEFHIATVPAVQVWPGRKSRAKTGSPALKLTRLSDFSGLLGIVLGSIAWLIVKTVLPINTSAGDFPLSPGWTLVFLCDKESSYWSFRSSLPFCFKQGSFQCIRKFLSLAIRLGMIGRRPYMFSRMVLECSLSWAELKCVALSVTIVSGRQWVVNILSRTLIVSEALVDAMVITSGHLEDVSTKTR